MKRKQNRYSDAFEQQLDGMKFHLLKTPLALAALMLSVTILFLAPIFARIKNAICKLYNSH